MAGDGVTGLIVPAARDQSTVLAHGTKHEPLGVGGVIPLHLKEAVVHGHPLLEIVQRLAYRLHGWDLDKILVLIALYNAGAPVYRFLKQQLVRLTTAEIIIPEYDPLAREVLQWMSANIMAKRTTQALVSSGSEAQTSMDNYPIPYGRRGAPTNNLDTDDFQCMPPIGKKIFWVGLRPYLLSRAPRGYTGSTGANFLMSGDKSNQPLNSLRIVTLGWSLGPLQDFVKKCHDYSVEARVNGGTITVHFASGSGGGMDAYGNWHTVTKSVRKLDTVDMEEHVKMDLIRDAEDYYKAETKKFYAECGIPYRRGFLFHGPPGTGKSSFSAALAGHLNCDIYMINLSGGDITDGRLHSLFLSLPKKCVVVIEDIDSAGIGREQELSEVEDVRDLARAGSPSFIPARARGRGKKGAARPNMVTLSGLLNAIDGNASQEGRLLIMTSNNPDALDEALTRPGRVDKRVHFGYLNEASARSIFMRLIGRHAVASGSVTPEEAASLSSIFARKLPSNTFTPAQVQNFLQYCRRDADKAIGEVAAWAEKEVSAPSPSKDYQSKEDDETKRYVEAQEKLVDTRVRLNGIVNALNGEKEEEPSSQTTTENATERKTDN
ncbi:P-loop containing nucleoside triphosphate hydrolase protein [Polyplosphaeria fusca]|uniref:P-loop containing nucleoside triphosphate hydrolase protein n=1 Tax=Polyplosphaeria fusca TaxID=682080 RepID=A0A9P4QWU9_9PLEO|nr:P-loop containing nucleoside triphosphate hydrolase protein [Polyplosphaeria fusca]